METVPPHKFVDVRWMDAVSEGRWLPISHVIRPNECISRGWLVADELTYVTLAATIQLGTGGEVSEISEVITIPRGMILGIREIDG